MACATNPASSDETSADTGKADGAGSSIRLIQAGMFRDDLSGPTGYVPKLVHFGFTDERGPDWTEIHDATITYQNHENVAVVVDVPADHKKLLAFVLYEESSYGPQATTPYYRKWSNANAYIDLAKHGHGSLMTFPVDNGAGYPFSNSCYQVYVDQHQYGGKITDILYGFTKATRADYDANQDVPWLDASDVAHFEGQVPATQQHDGGYKGSYVLLPEYVWVPEGENLVFKLDIDKYGNDGGYYCGGNQYFLGHTATQTYFAEP